MTARRHNVIIPWLSRLALLLGISLLASACGTGFYHAPTTAPSTGLSWQEDSYTFTTSRSQTSTAQAMVTSSQPITRMTVGISSPLSSYISAPSTISNIAAGQISIPLQITTPATPNSYLISGTLTVTADGTSSAINVYLNIWTYQQVPGSAITLLLPPNLISAMDGAVVDYSEPSNDLDFTVEPLPNPQGLSIKNFVVQQAIPAQPGDAGTQSLYDQASSVDQLTPGYGIDEATLFHDIGDFETMDVAYLKIRGSIIVITNYGLTDQDFTEILNSAHL